MSWWNRKPKEAERDWMADFCASLQQGEAIVKAEHDGRRAWRILVMNDMLADNFRHPSRRRYRFTMHELSQLSGVSIENMTIGRNENECHQNS
jgi:hypothetical protein